MVDQPRFLQARATQPSLCLLFYLSNSLPHMSCDTKSCFAATRKISRRKKKACRVKGKRNHMKQKPSKVLFFCSSVCWSFFGIIPMLLSLGSTLQGLDLQWLKPGSEFYSFNRHLADPQPMLVKDKLSTHVPRHVFLYLFHRSVAE